MSIYRIIKKFKRLLTRKQWSRLLPLLLLMMGAGIMETVSVSMILSFMDLVMNPSRLRSKRYITVAEHIFHTSNTDIILAKTAILMAILYIVKNVYVILEMRIQQKFVGNAMFETQKRLVSVLLERPYEFFMEASSGRILTMIYTHITNAFILLTQLLTMISEVIVAGMLILTILIISPIISLLMGIVLLFQLTVISGRIKPIIKRASIRTNESSQQLYKWILQAIQGIREVKIMHSQDYFLKRYEENGKKYVDAYCSYTVMGNVPRALIESVTMVCFFVTTAIFIYMGQSIGNMIPIISTIALAAVRLLPSANRISNGLSSIAFSETYVDELLEFIEEVNENIEKETETSREKCETEYSSSFDKERYSSFSREINLINVDYIYPRSDTMVLQGANLTIKNGETIGVVGESGAGKTTVVDIIMGLLIPKEGDVEVDGVNIHDSITSWIDQIGYIPQTIFLLDDSIRKNVAFGIDEEDIDDARVWSALKDAALGSFIQELPEGINTQIGERGVRLSGGQKQRLGIARALYRDPKIIFFDEATSALDNETEKEIMESINGLKGHKTMIIIAHRLTTIESCDHIYRVENGRVIQER